MKVLQVSKLYYPWIGGVETAVGQIAEGFMSDPDIEVEVLCCQSKGSAQEETIHGVKVTKAASLGMFMSMPISFDFILKFWRLSKHVDVLHIHHPFPLANLAFLFFRPKKAKFIVHYHSDIVRQRVAGWLLRPLIHYLLRRADKIILTNPNMLKSSSIVSKYKEKCEVIPFGFDVEHRPNIEESDVLELRKKYGKFVLFVGRLNYYKGVEYLIRAIAQLDAVPLVLVGDGKLKNSLQSLVKELNIEDRVFFVAPLEREMLFVYYKAAYLFVLSSIFKSEAFGLVLLDAMAMGNPVISTELGTGTSYVNKDGETGMVVEPKNVQALAEAIQVIMNNDELAKKYGVAAQKRVQEYFTNKSMLKSYKDLYLKLYKLYKL